MKRTGTTTASAGSRVKPIYLPIADETDDVRRLVLRRKAGEQIVIGEQVIVEIVSFSDGGVRLCIKAPRRVVVRRAELQPEPAEPAA